MELGQKQTQSLHLTTTMKESLELLSLPLGELESYLNKCQEENPLLEYADAFPKTATESDADNPTIPMGETEWDSVSRETFPSTSDYWIKEDACTFTHYKDDYNSFYNISKKESFKDCLLQQLGEIHLIKLGEQGREIQRIAVYLIGNLDKNGYLSENINRLAMDLHRPLTLVQKALALLQSLEPAGVAARNLEECLFLQLERLYPKEKVLKQIILEDMELLAEQEYDILAKKYQVSLKKMENWVKKIKQLQPYPATGFPGEEETVYILPEAVVDEHLQVHFLQTPSCCLRINENYVQLLQKGCDKNTANYIKNKLQQSKALLRNLDAREKTINKVILKLVELQKEYFIKGDIFMKPLTRKQLGTELGLHESTVSRAVKDKYLLTPRGMLNLNKLFSSQTGRAGSQATSAVKAMLVKLIEEEDKKHPWSDKELAFSLQKKGITISRRAVAKYREALGLLVASKRKMFY